MTNGINRRRFLRESAAAAAGVAAAMPATTWSQLPGANDDIRMGNVGKILCARGFCYKRRDRIGKVTEPTRIPDTIDYNLWSGPAPLIFEVRGLPMKSDMAAMDHYRGIRVGIVIECEDGYFAGGAGGGVVYDNDGKKIQAYRSSGGGGHSANFIGAVRRRKSSDLNAHIPKGHVSASLSHMANISHRLGQDASPDEIRESLKNVRFVPDRLEQLCEHLEANHVDPNKIRITLGAGLEFDPEPARFTGVLADKANELATRNYRKRFVVPENV